MTFAILRIEYIHYYSVRIPYVRSFTITINDTFTRHVNLSLFISYAFIPVVGSFDDLLFGRAAKDDV